MSTLHLTELFYPCNKYDCPKCGSDDVDKLYHAATFAVDECWFWNCN